MSISKKFSLVKYLVASVSFFHLMNFIQNWPFFLCLHSNKNFFPCSQTHYLKGDLISKTVIIIISTCNSKKRGTIYRHPDLRFIRSGSCFVCFQNYILWVWSSGRCGHEIHSKPLESQFIHFSVLIFNKILS